MSDVIDNERFLREAKLIKKDIIPHMIEILEENQISPETTALFFAETTKAVLTDIDNKDIKEMVIRVMLDDDNEIQ